MPDKKFRLDRTKFKMQRFEEADIQYNYWHSKTVEERLQAAYYLISIAYQFELNNPPRLNTKAFSMRKHCS